MTNPIDLLLQQNFRDERIDPQQTVSDAVFARRVYLDLIGLLPTPVELSEFLDDNRADKRRRLVRSLLDNRAAYADHWLTFWNDALRNAYRGTGFIDDGRRQITEWLYKSLYRNKPYNRFVHELISPVDGSEGFTRGIVWRGVVNASQRREMQAAQNVAQVFLGTNLKCASCHDSFISDWSLRDAYSLASVFAEKPLEISRCNKPIGEFSEPRFLYPQLGRIDAKASRKERMRQLADLLTSRENGRFSRTVVNRLWARFFGRGLVEPVDEMDNPAWNADLLDWLAWDLAEQGYDLKQTMARICASRAYQLPSVGAPEPGESEFRFHGPFVKRMTAEQFVDAVAELTGIWADGAPQMRKKDGRGQGGQIIAIARILASEHTKETTPGVTAKWIWSDPQAAKGTSGGRIFLRRTLELTTRPSRATAVLTCDNEFTLYVNGKKVASGANWQQPDRVDFTKHLVRGTNTFCVEAINYPDRATRKGLDETSPNPAGFLFRATAFDGKQPLWILESDAEWLWSAKHVRGWQQTGFKTSGWKHAAEIAPSGGAPWRLSPALLSPGTLIPKVRASLATADPLMRALGRPNREQVVTRRDSWTTTLQALELTNGTTLDETLKRGAKRWWDSTPANDRAQWQRLVDEMFLKGLGRKPTATERTTARELIGSPPSQQGIEDLLWVIAMLPEFQLIY